LINHPALETLSRRDFLKLSSLAVAALSFRHFDFPEDPRWIYRWTQPIVR